MFLIHFLVLCGLLGVGLSWKQPSCYQTKGTSTDEIRKMRESMENGFSALTAVLQHLAASVGQLGEGTVQPTQSPTNPIPDSTSTDSVSCDCSSCTPSSPPPTCPPVDTTPSFCDCPSTPPEPPPLVNSSLLTSCRDLPQNSSSGEYWIQNRVFCEVHRPEWNGDGVWTRVAYVDMRDPDQNCPIGLGFAQPPGSALRLCRRLGGGCSSTSFHTFGIEYSRVCGRVIGYQIGAISHPFYGYQIIENATLEAPYVEGVSLTYGRLPRKHIWTFATTADDITSTYEPFCECETSPPPFIGDDYFCDTGSRSHAQFITWYLDDPLWDGQGCGGTNTCCSLHNPPWFCKDLPEPTTEDIELRLCGLGNAYHISANIEQVELYIQ